ncbi:MAG: hypothetical protein GEV03_23855 [Streptosporangiales bacterium]|nr:hypothetical protein [Streptosporangiales bacterium]
MTAPIAVGVDGSEQSLLALDCATDEAVRRKLPLRIVHVLVSWAFDMPDGASVAEVGEWMRETGQKVVDDAVARAASRAPGHEVSGELVAGDPAPALLREAEGAHLVVLGSHGLGGFAGLLLGSVSHGVLHHAACPVAIVRATS